MPEVLVIDDEPNIRRMVGAILTAEGFSVRDAADGAAGVRAATEREPDAVLLDLMMPGELDGMAALSQLRERFPALPVVMMSGRAELSDAVRATKLGAFHFLEKPLTHEAMLLTIRSALELRKARREAQTLREEFGLTGETVGSSAAMERVRALIARIAPSDARDQLAHALHRRAASHHVAGEPEFFPQRLRLAPRLSQLERRTDGQ